MPIVSFHKPVADATHVICFFCARQGHSGTALHIYQPKPQTRDNKYDKEGRRENHTPDHTTYMYAMHAYSSMRQFQGRDI